MVVGVVVVVGMAKVIVVIVVSVCMCVLCYILESFHKENEKEDLKQELR